MGETNARFPGLLKAGICFTCIERVKRRKRKIKSSTVRRGRANDNMTRNMGKIFVLALQLAQGQLHKCCKQPHW